MEEKILAAHGSGGKLMNEMIRTIIAETLGHDTVQLDDAAVLNLENNRIAFTTDTFTITPIFFPGGDIGSLAVNGTVNDLSVIGSRPLHLSCALLLEEGFETSELRKILLSMKKAADYAEISVVTGDTKVVPKGKGDKIYINTSGIGVLKDKTARNPIEAGDLIIINGFIGDHGIAVMAERNKFTFTRGLVSDCAPMNHLIRHVYEAFPDSVKFMRDPTRGGVASVLNEISHGQNFGIKLFEEKLPVREEVYGVCEILGIDPLYSANEGKVLMVAKKDDALSIVNSMKEIKEGRDAAIIGEVSSEFSGKCYIETGIGGKRILPLLIEEQLPRIC